jgi:hypothetical protein
VWAAATVTGLASGVESDEGSAGVVLLDRAADPTESRDLANDPTHAKVKEEMAALAKKLPGR